MVCKRRNILRAAPGKHHIERQHIQKLESEVVRQGLFSDKIYFQHDNAKSHVFKIVKEKIAKFGRELLAHPPYSPDLAPSDYHLFCSLSNHF